MTTDQHDSMTFLVPSCCQKHLTFLAGNQLIINSAVADKPAEPAPITTTSGLDCAKEILGNVASASPDKEAFRNSLLPIPLKNIFFTIVKPL